MRHFRGAAFGAAALAATLQLGALEPATAAHYEKDSIGRLVAVTTLQGTTRYSYFEGFREPFLREVQRPDGSKEEFTLEVARTAPSFFTSPAEANQLSQSHNRFLFTGYEWQPEIKLYFTPSGRLYDPAFGRFVQQDSHLGDVARPPSLHRYAYGHSNPTTFIDPSGHEAAIVTLASIDPKVRERLEQQAERTGYNAAWWSGAMLQTGVETGKVVAALGRLAMDEQAQAELIQRAGASLKDNAPTILGALEGDPFARAELAAQAIEPRIEAYERGVDRYSATTDPVERGRIATETVFPEASVVAFGTAGLVRHTAKAFVVREGTNLASTETASVLEPAIGPRTTPQVPLPTAPIASNAATEGTIAAGKTPTAPARRVTGQSLADLRARFESAVKPAYWKEYARQIDEQVVTSPFGRGESNLARMRKGLPPLGPDGRPVQLHHRRPLSRGGTNDFDNLVPINQTTHQRYTAILHSEPFPAEQYHLQGKR